MTTENSDFLEYLRTLHARLRRYLGQLEQREYELLSLLDEPRWSAFAAERLKPLQAEIEEAEFTVAAFDEEIAALQLEARSEQV